MSRAPKNAIVIEIAPNALFQSVLKRSLGPECLNIGLTKRSTNPEGNINILMSAIGKWVWILITKGLSYFMP